MSERIVSIGLVQMACQGSKEHNLARALDGVAESTKRGARIVCLPELFLSPYFCQKRDDKQSFESAESLDGPTVEALSKAAKKHGIVLIGGSIFEKAIDGNFYNTAPIFGSDGSLLGSYRKTHIPEDPLYHEQHYFTPGDTGIRVFDTPFAKIAVLICYDQWFPEAARIAALRGAEIIFYPTAIGDIAGNDPKEGDWHDAWETVQRGHAIANNVFVAAVNRVGREREMSFFGGSFICSEFGSVLVRGGSDEEILVAECDLSTIDVTREGWGFMRNRRTECYKDIGRM